MQIHKKLTARLLSLVLSIAMVTTMTSATVFAAGDDAPLGRSGVGVSSIGTIKSIDKLEERFEPSTGEGAADHVYGLAVELNTPVEDLQLPDELTAMVERTTDEEPPVTTTEQEAIPVTWSSDKEYAADEDGTFIYTAELPEGYILAEGVNLPQIYVLVGGKTRDARANIKVKVNYANFVWRTSLQQAIESHIENYNVDVTAIDIIGGPVTTADWKYLASKAKNEENPMKLTLFLTSGTATVVNIPNDDINDGFGTFPPSIITVGVPKVLSIGTGAFYKCALLTSASFPSATSIGQSAFQGCKGLTTLKLGAVVPTVGTNAFESCPATRALGYVAANGTALEGSALTAAQAAYKAVDDGNINDDLWYGWTIGAATGLTVTINGTSYEGASLEEAVGKLPGGATAVTSLKITAGKVTTADWNYLTNLTAMTTFEIDSAVTSVADIPNSTGAAPIFPKSIVSVTVPQEIAIGKRAFSGCFALTSASFPAATTIGDYAFNSCAILASASFPKVTNIGTYAFSTCGTLTTLKLGATPPTVGTNAFHGGASPRALGYVDANGAPLTGTALATAIANYKNVTTAGAVEDGKWYGWTIEPVAYKAVTSITGVPTSARVGTNLALTGTVTPTDATNKDIVWTVKNVGATGARISGNTLSTTAAGTVVVTATIVNGLTTSSDFIRDFTITVSQFGGGGSSSGGSTPSGNVIDNPVGTKTAPPRCHRRGQGCGCQGYCQCKYLRHLQ